MKTSEFLSIALLATCLLSCNKEPQGSGGLVRHTIKAEIGELASKAQLGTGDNPKVLWSKNEPVDVWVGDMNYNFAGQNAEATSSTTFAGEAPADLGVCVLVSPRGASTAKSGDEISATLPAVQTAAAGGFDASAAILAGRGSGNGGSNLGCKHLYAGLRFQLSAADISRVTLSGLNNEKIAGAFTFLFDGSGNPIAGEGTAEEVVLTPSDGTYFTPNQWYYIIILPTVFTKGICLTATSASMGIGLYTQDGPITFSRARIKNKSGLDEAMTWSSASASVRNTYYGPANTFCLCTGESLTVDVSPRRILDGWIRSGAVFDGAQQADACAILWNTGSITASLSSQTLTLNAGASEGAALVAIKKGSTILWSFLVWVKDNLPATTLPNGKTLLPPLGGDCYFQWGRKDPLRSSASRVANQGSEGLPYSIANPDKYIKGVNTAYDWFCQGTGSQDETLWGDGGVKTVWDPCPEGYRVPAEADFAFIDEVTAPSNPFEYLEGHFTALGYISSIDGYVDEFINYWTRTIYGDGASALDGFESHHSTTVFENQTRDVASPVRCVRE